jgi:hypothetical protein
VHALVARLRSSCGLGQKEDLRSPREIKERLEAIGDAASHHNREAMMKQNQDCKPNPIDYLIITRPMFATCNPLLDFIQWKEQLGFKVGLLTVEWIDANYAGIHLAAKIKAAALDYYAGVRAQYILIVGDTEEDMPESTVGWYEPTEMYDLTKLWNVPTGAVLEGSWMTFSDSYYADSDPWPLDSDGHPHLTFPCYLDFDVPVGRFSVRDPNEIVNIVAKSKTFTPASSVIRVVDATFAAPSDPCTSWPPPAGDLASELACYCTAPYSIQRALADTGISFTERICHINDPSEYALAQNLILNSNSITEVVTHGGHRDNFFLPLSVVGGFTTIFPLYVASSCLINTFHWLGPDSMTETMLKCAKGPVAAAAAKNWYYFYKALGEGKPVGQAVYNKEKIGYPGIGQMDLLGDPSLVLCVRKTPPIGSWRPHRQWEWFAPFRNIWGGLSSVGSRVFGDKRK